MSKKRGKHAGGNHEQAEPRRLHQIFRPVMSQRLKHRITSPTSTLKGAHGTALIHVRGANITVMPWHSVSHPVSAYRAAPWMPLEQASAAGVTTTDLPPRNRS